MRTSFLAVLISALLTDSGAISAVKSQASYGIQGKKPARYFRVLRAWNEIRKAKKAQRAAEKSQNLLDRNKREMVAKLR